MARSVSRLLRATLAALLALGALGLLRPAPAFAANFVVTTVADSGPGSLRAAIAAAEASPGADTIGFALPGGGPWAINLAGTLPGITQPLTIAGPGTDRLTIRPATTIPLLSRFPLLVVNAPGQAVGIGALTLSGGRAVAAYGGNLRSIGGHLTLTDVRLSGGTAAACQGGAGAYLSNGTIALIRPVVTGNSAPGCGNTYSAGAGLYVDEYYGGTDLTIGGGSIVGNSATGSAGGGLAIERTSGVAGRTLQAWLQSVVIGTSASPNTASAYGGGLATRDATVTLADCVVSYNTASSGGGTASARGTLRLERSYVGYNRSYGLGGGIHVSSVAATLVDTTLVGNRAVAADSGEGINYGQGGGLYNEYGAVAVSGGSVLANSAAVGGGIMNYDGTLTVSGTAITHNSSTVTSGAYFDGGGGGIENHYGTATVTNSTIANNSAALFGGGIATRPNNATVTVTNSAITGNVARAGGGIHAEGGMVTVTNSTIANNRARYGGGIAHTAGAFTLSGSTVNGNTADGDGGGIGTTGLTVTNSTISGNSAGGAGGGIAQNNGTTTLTHTTVVGSTASQGAGLWVNYNGVSSSSLALRGSIVAGNGASDCAIVPGGSLYTNGFNVVGEGTGCPGHALGDLVYGGPLAALINPTLASNGGPTQTHALPAGSPAIDRLPPAHCTVAIDQRGVARPQGAGCDSGAYEAP